MNLYPDDGEADYLFAVDSRIRNLRARVARNPNPRDPEYDADAADQLEEIERERKIAQKEFDLGSMCLNELMVLTSQRLGTSYNCQLDMIRYELAKSLTEETH